MHASRGVCTHTQLSTFSWTENTHYLTPKSEIECDKSSARTESQWSDWWPEESVRPQRQKASIQDGRCPLRMGCKGGRTSFAHFMEIVTPKIGFEIRQNLEMWTLGKFVNRQCVWRKIDKEWMWCWGISMGQLECTGEYVRWSKGKRLWKIDYL